MQDGPRLLVVDDEEAICEGCRRVFSRQGFRVEKSVDAHEGLAMAAEHDYAAVLLDIKMPGMDGIEFLEQIRAKKPDLPVILMTGYPSIPNAVSAIRLGASGYVTKPFTPEEISQAVQKYLRKRPEESGSSPTEAPAETWAPASEGASFWHEAWFQAGEDGTVRVGVMLPRAQASSVKETRLPGIGEVVYQGLPMAALTLADDSRAMIPAPVSGLVLAVNESIGSSAGVLAADPCGRGWLAVLSPTRLEEESKNTVRRRVLLFNADAAAAKTQQERLAALGCHVRLALKWDDVRSALESNDYPVVVMDASRFGEEGPSLVGRISELAPSVKIVLAATEGGTSETAYRAHRIFYYAVEPFADNEIAEVLEAAFRAPSQNGGAAADRRKAPAGSLCSILITNRNGRKVRLLVAPGLLRREDGLGAMIRHKLLDKLFPMETVSGDASLDSAHLLKQAESCDRLVVLMTKDVGRLPGSLIRDTKAEFASVSGDDAGKVTFLVVQPSADGGIESFDARTAGALADQIIQDMAGY